MASSKPQIEDEKAMDPPSSTRALQNELILKEVLSYLKPAELKATSLVNRKWYRESRLQMSMSIKQDRKMAFGEKYFWGKGAPEMVQLQELINTRLENDLFPCTKFYLDMIIFQSPEKWEILGNFLQAVAPFVEEIGMSHSYDIRDTKLRANLPVAEYKKLKKLELNMWNMADSKRNTTNCFVGILQQSPNLTSLVIELGENSKETIDLLIKAMDSVQGRKIKQLELWGNFTDEHFMRLGCIGLKLQCFNFCTFSWCQFVEPNLSLKSFLESQSDSLEELQLNGYLKDNLDLIILPRMPKLKRFWLSMCKESEEVAFSGFNYHQQFPNLKFFSISITEKPCWQPFLNSDMKPFEPLESLEFKGVMYPRRDEDISWILHAARIFPNVNKLKIDARDNYLKSVFNAFGKVEQLTLHLSEKMSLNKLLTGYSTEELMEDQMKPFPEFLHKLKVLKLTDSTIGWTLPEDNRTLDQTCSVVLFKLRSFQCLDLSASYFAKITERSLQEMRNKFLVFCGERHIIRDD